MKKCVVIFKINFSINGGIYLKNTHKEIVQFAERALLFINTEHSLTRGILIPGKHCLIENDIAG